MPLQIVVVSPLATVAPHFETELEIMQRHLDEGDAVEMLACHGGLPCCDFNSGPSAAACGSCVGRRRAGLKLLSGRVRTRELTGRIEMEQLAAATTFRVIEDLKRFRLDEFDIGYAVASSLISLTRDPSPALDAHCDLVERLMRAAWATYQQVLESLRRRRPDRVYVFNGRFASVRAVLRACQAAGVDCWIHERGCDPGHYQIFRNRLPHDIEYLQERMREAWERSPHEPEERARIAGTWFQDRVARTERAWHSFVKEQTRGALPAGWDTKRRNVVLFTSSEDEFAAIGDSWRAPFYASQVDGIENIVRDFPAGNPALRMYIRVHPNLKGQTNADLRRLREIRHPQVELIPADDPVDSYQLMREAEKVVTFGSSLGIEALYWGRPSLLLGTCYYRGFRGIYQPADHAEALRLLAATLSPAENRSDALVYGYWFQTHGIPFRYFVADGLFSGRFKGEVVHPPHPRPPLPLRWLHKVGRAVRGRRRGNGGRAASRSNPGGRQ